MKEYTSLEPLDQLREVIVEFRDERNWSQFHTLKNLFSALSIEAAELSELTLWKTDDDVTEALKDDGFRQHLREECADIFIYLILVSEYAGFDLVEAGMEKIAINAEKYPVKKAFGISTKYDKL